MASRTPGVAVDQFAAPASLDFRTGVPAFVARRANAAGLPTAVPFGSWHDVVASAVQPSTLLWNAVQGFFINGGTRCWIVSCDIDSAGSTTQLEAAIDVLADIDDVDLVCAPDLAAETDSASVQAMLVTRCHAARDDWFVILDAPKNPNELATWLAALRAKLAGARPQDVAVYHPWLIPGGDVELAAGQNAGEAIAPSGHIAGVYSRTDTQTGVHKAPANEVLEGVVDLYTDPGDIDGTNTVRALPGRGIRIWGARTLASTASNATDPGAHVAIRRLVLTLRRWLVRALDWAVFEANDVRLWVRIRRELDARLTELFTRGAFRGKTAEEAFFVKCDAENNPPQERANGKLFVDIGIAAAVPKEFIQIRLVRSAEGLAVT